MEQFKPVDPMHDSALLKIPKFPLFITRQVCDTLRAEGITIYLVAFHFRRDKHTINGKSSGDPGSSAEQSFRPTVPIAPIAP